MTTHRERRRCLWCKVRLRWWQHGYCRTCGSLIRGDAGIYLQGGGPPFPAGTRRDAPPDRMRARS